VKMILIDTTSVKQKELRERPEFKLEVDKATKFFNSPKFDHRARTAVALHEGTHLFFTREAAAPFGGFEPRVYGPAVEYSKTRDEFYPSVGAVQSLPKSIRLKADPIAVAKTFLAPNFVMKLLKFDYSFVSEDGDIENFELWCAERFPNDSFEFRVSLWIQTEDSINRDLGNKDVEMNIWRAAYEYEHRVFGPVN